MKLILLIITLNAILVSKELQGIELKTITSDFKNSLGKQFTSDTVWTNFNRSSGASAYTLFEGDNPFPMIGSNNTYHFIGSKFSYQGNAFVDGVIVAFARKNIEADSDTYFISVHNVDPSTGLPELEHKAVGAYSTAQIDTSLTELKYTYFQLTQDIDSQGIINDFAVMFQTRHGEVDDDLIQIFGNLQGNALGSRSLVCFVRDENQVPSAAYLDNLIDYNNPLNPAVPDFDILMIPVLSYVSSVKNDNYQVYPNPARNLLNIDLMSSIGTIQVFNQSGNVVLENKLINGNNIIDISFLNHGTYVYFINDGKNKFAYKFIKE